MRDAERVNRIVQRDFPEADMTAVLSEPQHVALVDGESEALFLWRGPGIYEVHVCFAARGREALRLGHAMLGWMKERRKARLFWAAIPTESRKVIMFTRLMGWKSEGAIQTTHGEQAIFSFGD